MSVQYNGGCSVQREMFSTPGDIMSTLGVFSMGDIMGEGHWENN